MKKKTTLLLMLLFTFLVQVSADAQIVTSSADDGSPGTLRSQIASASSGDIITFIPTVTTIVLTMGQISVDKNLTITGTPILTTTINGNANGRIFDITTGTILLNNLTLVNGLADNGGAIQITNADLTINASVLSNNIANGTTGSGGAIYVMTNADLTMLNSTISDNRANRAGGGIESVAGTMLTLTNIEFDGNNAGMPPATAAPGNGGALHITGNGSADIIGGTVSANMAAAEGGGLWNGAGTMSVDGTVINNNTAGGAAADNGGGGIYNLNNGTLIIENATISNNTASGLSGSGGGILNDVGATLSITNSIVSGNVANRAGGGIETNSGPTSVVTITNVTLNDNSVLSNPGNGGGLHVTGAGIVNISGGTVNLNDAGNEGGGLWNGSGTMTIDGTTISGNTASGNLADQGGGGIYNLNGGTLNISDAIITNNVANGIAGSGGGILVDTDGIVAISDSQISGNTANRAGGGIEDNSGPSGTFTLTNVSLNENITFNAPGNGGGMHITGAGNVSIIGGTVNMNEAGAEGGGLWNGSGMMTINGTVIDGNTASGAGADQGGGGIYNLNGGTLTITDATISNNIADGTAGSGGGILNDVGSQLSITDSTIDGNTAVRAGGGIEDNSGTSTLVLNNVNIINNTVTGPPGNGGGLHITGGGNINITGGSVDNNIAALEGGGLWNGSGTMNINGTTITDNVAQGAAADDGGGGIFNNGGTVNVTDAMISRNTATGTSGSGGGALSFAGTMTFTDSNIDGNSANRAGGGIEIINGTLTLTDTNLTDNDVDGGSGTANPGNGGGLHISAIATTTITRGNVSGNSAAREGGGLWNQTGGTMTLNDVSVDANTAGGPDAIHGGGGIFNNGGDLIVNRSTISNNISDGAMANGGGIHVKTGTAMLMLSTVSGNTSAENGGGVYNNGGLMVNASTIAYNSAAANGGGISNNSMAMPMLKNTIVALNNAVAGDDMASSAGNFMSNGYNLIGQDDTNVFPAMATDIEGANPLLGPLSDNGGETLTHPLLTGSPAYNAGDPADMFNDQTNAPVFGSIRDIGSVESQTQLALNEVAMGLRQSVIYPNPISDGNFNIALSNDFGNNVRGKVIELASGKVIQEFAVSGETALVALNNFSTGIYIIQLISDRSMATHKLVITK